jgi:hypothetical protein
LTAKRTIKLSGEYCTSTASIYNVPIRILLVIDTSRSMEINDPAGYRGQAAADLITAMSGTDQDVAFGLIEFNTGANQLTDGFMSDPAALTAALNGLNKKEGFTNYLAALGLARTMIHEDLVKVAEQIRLAEENGEDTRYMRPWYFVVFLSDGIPRMPGGVLQSTESILFEVEELMDVPEEALGITLHTAFLGAQDDEQRPEAEALLKKMAEAGHGTYFSFEKGEEIDFSIFDFEVKRLYDIKQFLVFNRSAILVEDLVLADSDGDGLDDVTEDELGSDPTICDTDGDGLGDGFEHRSALDPVEINYACDAEAEMDTDRDGLSNCEEIFLNFDKLRFDTDGDMFPDGLEFFSNANPGDVGDVFEDLDFDTVITADEIRQRTNPIRHDAEIHEYYAYSFELKRTFDRDSGKVCYRFNVGNVTLANTLATEDRQAGVNQVVFYFIESPEDDAEKLFMLHELIVPIEFKQGRKADLDIGVLDFEMIASQEAREE